MALLYEEEGPEQPLCPSDHAGLGAARSIIPSPSGRRAPGPSPGSAVTGFAACNFSAARCN